MLALMYLVLVLLLIVWLVVKLVLKLVLHDTVRHDMNYLWEHYNLSRKDIHFPKPKR
ncbi:hypothetical protein [Brevibacillus sp. H7]|jgi:hypothetical protein|uniref:hypothetical protein n=1 Tax=Brevibacillus sp. H7 TaxID=3349138 RepID=UPI0037F2DB99